MKKFLYAFLPGILSLAWALFLLAPTGPWQGQRVAAFAEMPVLQGGRIKPLDSVARNALLELRGKQSVPDHGKSVPAQAWILDVLFRPDVADAQPTFVINDPDVLGLLGIEQKADRYYSFATLRPRLTEIERQAEAAQALEASQRNLFQKAVVNLYQRLVLYHRLKHSVQVPGLPLAQELLGQGGGDARERLAALDRMAEFRLMPPAGNASDWLTVGGALTAAPGGLHPMLVPLAKVGAAYEAGNAKAFNEAAAEYRAVLARTAPDALLQASREAAFNRAQPFYTGIVLFGLAFALVVAAWLFGKTDLLASAWSVLAAGAVVHTAGLAARIILQGRPPVTNLYSSAVFVGWVMVVLGLCLERMHRRGFGTAVAAAAGFASLIVAHHLQGGEDTMEMMRAVLDSNFWLGTHVVTITIGYGATFLAGILAMFQAVRRLLPQGRDAESTRTLLAMIYGVLCFALFFSFVGTILGGIWADQSWGRFWGWDPKENGALLIVLWNAIILHARWGGFIRERGLLACALFGNIITSLSWFGVNMLGVGLHSYGFMDSAVWALIVFALSQFAFMALCALPGVTERAERS